MGRETKTGRLDRWLAEIDLPVFLGGGILLLPFLLLGGFLPQLLANWSAVALDWITVHLDWLYLGSVNIFVLVAILMALSPFGKIRLGRDDERPQYSRLSWIAMLFSAGMGIGLVFWSIAEPLYHLGGPPTGTPGTPEAGRLAFSIFFHHWGIHAWATYVVVGLPLAYFRFRHGCSDRISSCFSTSDPAENSSERRLTAFGRLVDIFAIWATVLGVVTSLGLGALQITSGLSITLGLPDTQVTTAGVVIVITLLFILSAISGISRGIRYLSLLNVGLMLFLLSFFLGFGPEPWLLHNLFRATGDYLAQFIPLSTSFALFDNVAWTRSWTVFYWAWWIAWGPFVGAFIASISRGRTIREFILVVMVVPVIFSFLFSSALGGTAVHMQLFESIELLETVKNSIEATLFTTLAHLPLYQVTALVANLLIASFFITSADSATYVISSFSRPASAGSERISPPLIVYWGVILGGLALVLVFSGGLKPLQTASIVGALPFVVIIYLLLARMLRELVAEHQQIHTVKRQPENLQ